MSPKNQTHFKFKRFQLKHGFGSFKIGTDAVILGASAGRGMKPQKILDIGTGSGIIALMMAQRFESSELDAVEIDQKSFEIAKENFSESPFNQRLKIFHRDVRSFKPDTKYDLIVCNPPYFVNSLKPEKNDLTRSKHSIHLKIEDIFAFSSRYLSQKGELCLILPFDLYEKSKTLQSKFDIKLCHCLHVHPNLSKGALRFVLTFSKELKREFKEERLFIEKEKRHDYHPDYVHLCRDFYLNFNHEGNSIRHKQ